MEVPTLQSRFLKRAGTRGTTLATARLLSRIRSKIPEPSQNGFRLFAFVVSGEF